jgi:DNA mismatch endonuclease (patch repair protein)
MNSSSPPASDEATRRRMQRVRQRNTAPELRLRRWLWRAGHRFVTHAAKLPGRPDLSNTRRKWAIFVHGCFWHGHEGCPKSRLPKRNVEFWADKIAANVARDARKEEALRELGFDVYVVWDCSLGELDQALTSAELSFPLPRLPPRDR